MHVLCRCPSTFCLKLRTAGKSAGQTGRGRPTDRRPSFLLRRAPFPSFLLLLQTVSQSVSRSHPPSLVPPGSRRSALPLFLSPRLSLRRPPSHSDGPAVLSRGTSFILQPVARPFRRPSPRPQSGNCPRPRPPPVPAEEKAALWHSHLGRFLGPVATFGPEMSSRESFRAPTRPQRNARRRGQASASPRKHGPLFPSSLLWSQCMCMKPSDSMDGNGRRRGGRAGGARAAGGHQRDHKGVWLKNGDVVNRSLSSRLGNCNGRWHLYLRANIALSLSA